MDTQRHIKDAHCSLAMIIINISPIKDWLIKPMSRLSMP